MKLALDFGCGPNSMAATRAIGYTTIGVELAPKPACKPMVVYSGKGNLPFKDGVFDLINSQQVIEHVRDLDTYFKEARRTLRRGGVLFAEFPTRAMPYDSHKQTWFKHWFRVPSEPWFCFRWPWQIRKAARRYFHIEDHTRARLRKQGRPAWLPAWLFNQSWVLR